MLGLIEVRGHVSTSKLKIVTPLGPLEVSETFVVVRILYLCSAYTNFLHHTQEAFDQTLESIPIPGDYSDGP